MGTSCRQSGLDSAILQARAAMTESSRITIKRALQLAWLLAIIVSCRASPAWAYCSPIDAPTTDSQSVARLLQAYRAHRTSVLDVVRQRLARIAKCNGGEQGLNSVIALNPGALTDAQAADRLLRSGRALPPLFGVPVLIKGNYNVGGMLNDGAMSGWAQVVRTAPLFEALEVRRLRAAGAIILGRGNLDDLAYHGSTTSSLYGQTLNPYSPTPTNSPGGSSGGPAVSLAIGIATIANGTDDGGSNRIPAQFSGVVGLKTTYGLVSKWGVIPTFPLFDAHGPLARTVEDVARMLQVVAGADTDDAATQAAAAASADYVSHLRTDALKGKKLGIVRANLFSADPASPVGRLFEQAVHDARVAGATVIDVDISVATRDGMYEAYRDLGGDVDRDYIAVHCAAGVNAMLRYLNASYGPQGDTLFRQLYAIPFVSDIYHLAGEDLERALQGRWEDKPETMAFEARRRELVARLVKAMDQLGLDALIWPTLPYPSAVIGPLPRPTALKVANFLGVPELSVPIGRTHDVVGGVNLSFLGRPFDEGNLLALGFAYEHARRGARSVSLGLSKSRSAAASTIRADRSTAREQTL
jgi:Asp-tRNA(Asn)/Glu-tRNA(Gln) amidotransferase A subunit family amidase